MATAWSWVALGLENAGFALGVRARRHWLAKFALSGAVTFFALTLLVVFYGPTTQQKIQPTAPWMKPLATTWELQSPGKVYSIATASDRQRNGEDSLRFEIRGQERWVDTAFETTYRSEIATREYPPMDSTKWYSFSVYFPEGFPIEGNRISFAEWQAQIDFGESRISPPLSFRFEGGNLKIKLRHSDGDAASVGNPEDVPDLRLFSTNQFALGQWHDFVVQAKWSWQSNGLVNIWWNQNQIVTYRGPVGYRKKTGPQFKFGLYRDDTDKTYVAHFNRVKSGGTPQEVGFQLPGNSSGSLEMLSLRLVATNELNVISGEAIWQQLVSSEADLYGMRPAKLDGKVMELLFTHNYERVLSADAAKLFFVEVYDLSRAEGWTSDQHFTADGTLVEAWASLKSFVRKDGTDQAKITSAKDDDPGNPTVNFHGEQRCNDTHRSTTDPDSVLYRKAKGQASKLCFGTQVLMENRHGLCAAITVHNPIAQDEPTVALAQVDQHRALHEGLRWSARRPPLTRTNPFILLLAVASFAATTRSVVAAVIACDIRLESQALGWSVAARDQQAALRFAAAPSHTIEFRTRARPIHALEKFGKRDSEVFWPQGLAGWRRRRIPPIPPRPMPSRIL